MAGKLKPPQPTLPGRRGKEGGRKRARLHAATITAAIAILDDQRSYGTRQAQVTVLMDSEQEWQVAIDHIRQAVQKLNDQLNPPQPTLPGRRGKEGGPHADSS